MSKFDGIELIEVTEQLYSQYLSNFGDYKKNIYEFFDAKYIKKYDDYYLKINGLPDDISKIIYFLCNDKVKFNLALTNKKNWNDYKKIRKFFTQNYDDFSIDFREQKYINVKMKNVITKANVGYLLVYYINIYRSLIANIIKFLILKNDFIQIKKICWEYKHHLIFASKNNKRNPNILLDKFPVFINFEELVNYNLEPSMFLFNLLSIDSIHDVCYLIKLIIKPKFQELVIYAYIRFHSVKKPNLKKEIYLEMCKIYSPEYINNTRPVYFSDEIYRCEYIFKKGMKKNTQCEKFKHNHVQFCKVHCNKL